MENKTICAISTPIGVGGISIIRVSGKDSIKIANKVFSCKKESLENNPRKMLLGTFNAGAFKEKCMAVFFKEPNSYTGEDMVEFQCHGGMAVSTGVLNAIIEAGGSLAEAGEFTKRAFINGKLSLDEAEGVIDIINSESESEIKAGYNLLSGNLKKEISDMQNVLTNLLAKIEVTIDYPEEDLEDQTVIDVKKDLENIKTDLIEILNNSQTGVKIKSGYRVAIVGKTNVGKSSLLNAMLNFDKAIVTNIQGTTRDLVEDTYTFNGVKFILVDSAGIRETDDVVEKIGVEKSRDLIKVADVVLVVLDGSAEIENEDIDIINRVSDKNAVLVINKLDTFNSKNIIEKIKNIWKKDNILISAKNKTGIFELKEKIFKLLIDSKILNSNVLLTNVRHINLVKDSLEQINNALNAIDNNLSLDMISIDIQSAWSSLGEITGTCNTDEIVNTIFSKFCVGK